MNTHSVEDISKGYERKGAKKRAESWQKASYVLGDKGEIAEMGLVDQEGWELTDRGVSGVRVVLKLTVVLGDEKAVNWLKSG